MVCCMVHSHLKDILGYLQTEGHMQEMVPAMMHVEVVRYKDFASRWMFQKQSLALSLLKHVAPLR